MRMSTVTQLESQENGGSFLTVRSNKVKVATERPKTVPLRSITRLMYNSKATN